MIRLTAACLIALLACGGCAHYEYDLVKPPEFARHISTKSDEVVKLDPLEYRLRTADNRLVIRIYNPTDDAIELLGGQSVVVDPQNQSHPLRNQTIAPASFIKLILPPIRPTIEHVGSNFGVGWGVGRVKADGWPYDYDEPRYYAVYDEGNEFYWDWDGQTDVRVNLVFRRTGKTFSDEFVFHRQKM